MYFGRVVADVLEDGETLFEKTREIGKELKVSSHCIGLIRMCTLSLFYKGQLISDSSHIFIKSVGQRLVPVQI